MPSTYRLLLPAELDEMSLMDIEDQVIAAPIDTFDPRTIAWAYKRLGKVVIPICDPKHEQVSERHVKGGKTQRGTYVQPCHSPGKAPIWPQYQKLKDNPPSDGDIGVNLQRHRGNFGSVVLNGQVILDVDPRNGGDMSLEMLLAKFGRLPETQEARTGSGGSHYLFTIPPGTPHFKVSGTLARIGYPGLDWKGPGQQHIVGPSVHAKGGVYLWNFGQGPSAPIAACPQWLMNLILEAEKADPLGNRAKKKDTTNGDTQVVARWAEEDVIAMFKAEYGPGERNGALLRLTSILRGHGLPEDDCFEFMATWYPAHLVSKVTMPTGLVIHGDPFSDEEAEACIRGCYRTYGEKDAKFHDHGRRYLRRLRENLGLLTDAEVADMRKDQERAARGRRRALMSESRGMRFLANSSVQADDADFDNVLVNLIASNSARAAAEGRGVMFANLTQAPSQNDLLYLLEIVEGPNSKAAQAVRECGQWMHGVCRDHPKEHGEQVKPFQTSCRQPFHACLDPARPHFTPTLRRIAGLMLKNLEGGASYREVWMAAALHVDIYQDEVDAFRDAIDGWDDEVKRLAHRKSTKATVLSRSISCGLARPESVAVFKIGFLEEVAGDADAEIELLCKRMNAHVIGDRKFQRGYDYQIQLIEDASAPLLFVRDMDDVQLFQAFWSATRLKHLFQTMGALHQWLLETPDEPPGRCEVCQGKIRLQACLAAPKHVEEASPAPLSTGAPQATAPPRPQPALF